MFASHDAAIVGETRGDAPRIVGTQILMMIIGKPRRMAIQRAPCALEV
jgi:hypothetical protein